MMPSTGGLMGFVKVTLRCLGCKAAISEAEQGKGAPLCANCKSREAEVYCTALQKVCE